MIDLQMYRTLVFDCDGVVLDSNAVKTEAFRRVAHPFGEAAAMALVVHHQTNGGVSRYEKFRHFITNILNREFDEHLWRQLLAEFASEVHRGLLDCAVAPGLDALRAATCNTRWMIVSGGDQEELRYLFKERALDGLFDAGIHGSPSSKAEILLDREADGTLYRPALFLGDSRLDHEAARGAGMDFVFVSGWTELSCWRTYIAGHALSSVPRLSALLEHGSA